MRGAPRRRLATGSNTKKQRTDFSLVDRTSFALMRRLGIDRVASLDAHFAVFRFGPKRGRSFHVLR